MPRATRHNVASLIPTRIARSFATLAARLPPILTWTSRPYAASWSITSGRAAPGTAADLRHADWAVILLRPEEAAMPKFYIPEISATNYPAFRQMMKRSFPPTFGEWQSKSRQWASERQTERAVVEPTKFARYCLQAKGFRLRGGGGNMAPMTAAWRVKLPELSSRTLDRRPCRDRPPRHCQTKLA